jgi:hypothetical protein
MNDNGRRTLDRAYEGLEHEVPDRVSRAIRWLRDPQARWIRIPLGILRMRLTSSFLPIVVRMRLTSSFLLIVVTSLCAGDLVAKSGASTGSPVRPPNHSSLVGLRRSRTLPLGGLGCHWATNRS